MVDQQKQSWRIIAPVAAAIAIALVPVPEGLPVNAWYYFAVFVGIVTGLVLEPLPNSAISLIGISFIAVLAPWVLYAPADMAKPGFNMAGQTAKWALSGFSSTTVWLVGGAFIFALGYEKTGLGRRIALVLVRVLGKNTLTLGYAVALSDAVLAPFTPSTTARSAGLLFPVVRNLPALYESKPSDPSARKIGGYVLWTTFAATNITSSMFMTGCAPNFLALEFTRKIAHVDITYAQWMTASLPYALPLLLVLPLLVYLVYPPQIKRSEQVSDWARDELVKMGPISRHEQILTALVLGAMAMWIVGSAFMDAALVALTAVSLMLIFRVVTWGDIARDTSAWTTIFLLATLLTLADGLSQVGFVKWFAQFVASHVHDMQPMTTIMILVAVYFYAHYLFASLTAHTTALFPVMLGVGMGIPGIPIDKLALSLALTTGLMGVLTPYASGAAIPYYSSGFIKPAHFWMLGGICGTVFIAAFLLIGIPLIMVM